MRIKWTDDVVEEWLALKGQGKMYKEIAEIYNAPTNTVKTMCIKARNRKVEPLEQLSQSEKEQLDRVLNGSKRIDSLKANERIKFLLSKGELLTHTDVHYLKSMGYSYKEIGEAIGLDSRILSNCMRAWQKRMIELGFSEKIKQGAL